MEYSSVMNQDRRGFRFLIDASAEIAPENSPSATVSVRATEISLHGCHLETPAPFAEDTAVFVKIFYAHEYFEAKATVIYVKPGQGMGVTFRDMKPHCRIVLQKWILAALRTQSKEE
jgi:PilZ domain